MRVNLQNSLQKAYKAYNNTISNNISFQGIFKNRTLSNNHKNNGSNVLSKQNNLENTPAADEFSRSYENKLDDAYNEGYEDGLEDAKKRSNPISAAAFIGLAALQLANTYSDYKAHSLILDSQYNTAEYINDSIDRKLEILSQDIHLDHAAIAAVITEIMTTLDELNEQKDYLTQKINTLPEDSEEALELKEELQNIKEQYKLLEEKYWDFMSEYLKPDDNDNNDKNIPNLPDTGNNRTLSA